MNHICHRQELSTYDSSRLSAPVNSQLGLFTLEEVKKSLPTDDVDASWGNLISLASEKKTRMLIDIISRLRTFAILYT